MLYQYIDNIDELNGGIADNSANNIYKCLLKLPNLYTSLHIIKDTDEFNTVINLSVIIFKLKYKPFK